MKDKENQIEERLDRTTALRVLQDLSKRMYSNLDLFGHPTLVIDRPKFEEVRKKYLDELSKDSVVLSREEYERITKELVTEQRATEIAKEYFEKMRKETAEKILNDLVKNCQYTFSIDGKPIVELDGDFILNAAKSYGIKIKE